MTNTVGEMQVSQLWRYPVKSMVGGRVESFELDEVGIVIVPEFLRNPASESGAVIDYRDWQVPLGRRFRALKL